MAEPEDWPDIENKGTADLQQAETLEKLRPVVSGIGHRFGFRFYKVYKAPIPHVTSLRQLLLLTDLPDAFFDAFDTIGYTWEELAQMRVIERSQLTEWTLDRLIEDVSSVKNAQHIQLLGQYGIGRGVYVNIAPVDGPVRILSFFGRDEPLTAREAEHLTVLAVQVLHSINRIEKRRDWDNAGLTSLEMECLLLASQGQEAHEIGRRVGLSGRTVLYLVNSVCSKLNVSNLEQAVAEALRCGFIG